MSKRDEYGVLRTELAQPSMYPASLWQQVGQRVDALDKALPGSYVVPQRPRLEKTFWQDYQTGFARWAGRSVAGYALDSFHNKALFPHASAWASSKLSPFCDGYVNYQRMLKIGQLNIFAFDRSGRNLVTNKVIPATTHLLSQTGWKNYKAAVRSNFLKTFQTGPNPFLLPGEKITVGSYLKNTVRGYNLGQIRDAFQTGNVFTGLARCLGLGFFAYDIVRETQAAYQAAKVKEEGTHWTRWNTLKTTVLTALRQTVKSAISWEVATVGLVIGTAIFPIGFYPALLAGIALGTVFSKIAGCIFDRVVPKTT